MLDTPVGTLSVWFCLGPEQTFREEGQYLVAGSEGWLAGLIDLVLCDDVCHIWWKRGERPPGLCDKRFTFAYIFAAAEPGSDNAFALVMPYADTAATQDFLDCFSKTIAGDEHAVMILDQAGWHRSNALAVPAKSHWCPCRPTRLS